MAVAMKMADVLKGLDVIIVPTGGPEGLNPLDLTQVTTMFGLTPNAGHTTTVAAPALAAPLPAAEPAPAPVPEPAAMIESEAPMSTEVIPDALR
jgi:hypothetical protein